MKCAAILLVLFSSSAAFAGIRDYVGAWHLALHGERCNINLLQKPSHGGYALTQKCGDAFGVQSAAAWKPYDGGIVFLSDAGTPVVTFEATEEIYLASNNPDLMLRKL